MTKAIEILMEEHRLIERVLASLHAFAGQLAPGQPQARERMVQFAEFFSQYADRLHHGKEEDRLFKVMTRHGFPENAGPILVMHQEHDLGRMYVRGLAEIGGAEGDLTADEADKAREHAAEFVALLAAHIQKEDRILYPAAVNAVPDSVMTVLAAEFEKFDVSEIGDEQIGRLCALAETLTAAFPADSSVLGGGGMSCGAH